MKLGIPKEYIKLLKIQNFDVLQKEVYNYEKFLSPYFKRIDKLKISKALKIECFPNGSVSVCENYFDNDSIPFNLLSNVDINFFLNLSISKDFVCEKVAINPKK